MKHLPRDWVVASVRQEKYLVAEFKMPRPMNPDLPEFYVYSFNAYNRPFYIGVGRSARASDRIRFVRRQMEREAEGSRVRWSFSSFVMAELLKRGVDIRLTYVARDLVRADALQREIEEIERLVEAGFLLANVQHNRCRFATPRIFIDALMQSVEGL